MVGGVKYLGTCSFDSNFSNVELVKTVCSRQTAIVVSADCSFTQNSNHSNYEVLLLGMHYLEIFKNASDQSLWIMDWMCHLHKSFKEAGDSLLSEINQLRQKFVGS
jgi:hypothetical protein